MINFGDIREVLEMLVAKKYKETSKIVVYNINLIFLQCFLKSTDLNVTAAWVESHIFPV